MSFITFLLYRLLQNKSAVSEPHPLHPREIIKNELSCKNHGDRDAVGTCGICEEPLCEKCLKEHDKLYFCPEHYQMFLGNKWEAITTVKTTPDDTEKGMFIYNFKGQIWKNEQIPSYVMIHYKINVEGDFIESYINLYAREQEKEELLKRLKDHAQQ